MNAVKKKKKAPFLSCNADHTPSFSSAHLLPFTIPLLWVHSLTLWCKFEQKGGKAVWSRTKQLLLALPESQISLTSHCLRRLGPNTSLLPHRHTPSPSSFPPSPASNKLLSTFHLPPASCRGTSFSPSLPHLLTIQPPPSLFFFFLPLIHPPAFFFPFFPQGIWTKCLMSCNK